MAAARRGSPAEITVFSNCWTMPMAKISPQDAMDVFLSHLQEDRVPRDTTSQFTDPENCAFASMLGLSKLGDRLPENGPMVRRLADAWPGIYKWSVFIYSSRIERLDRTNSRRRTALDVLSSFWYCIESRDVIREAMLKTPMTVEIATRLWLEEDGEPFPTTLDAPAGSCVLGNLLKFANKEQLDRVLRMAGGKSDEIAKLALARLQRALKGPRYNATHLTIFMDFLNSISRVASHPLRHALLGANVIWIITTSLVKLSIVVNTSPDPGFLDAMTSGFGYLRNCLESTEGFTWVAQSVSAGLLQALCDCSTRYAELDPDDYKMIEDIVGDILPRYLVFRSVIQAVDSALIKIDKGAHKARVEKSILGPTWKRFYDLAQARALILAHIEEQKGNSTTCDNVKCHKIGPREQFRRCSACLNTFYCSKECQATAWKEGDHKTMCKLKQRERMEGRPAPVSKRDYQFMHYFSMFDARMHLRELRAIARRDFPGVPLHFHAVSINHAVRPPTYALRDIRTYTLAPHPEGTPNAEARNEALIEKVQTHPERFTLVDMAVSAGQGTHVVLALATGDFWDIDEGEREEDVPRLSKRDIEMGRVVARLLKNIRKNPALKAILDGDDEDLDLE